MEIQKRLVSSKESTPKLYQFLKQNEIVFDEPDNLGKIGLYILEILESHPAWPIVREIAESEGEKFSSETLYSEEEYSSAQWLRVWSQWRFGYPLPDMDFGYLTVSYSNSNYCASCGCGLEQNSPFRIKKVPNWGKRCFGELNWVGDVLFLNERARDFLSREKFSGISTMEVLNKNGKEVLSGIFQLKINSVLEEGLISTNQSIRETTICKECGRKRYIKSGIGMIQYRHEIFEGQPDFVLTGDYFGAGRSANKNILIRQSVYRALVENKLDRNLAFEPIQLV